MENRMPSLVSSSTTTTHRYQQPLARHAIAAAANMNRPLSSNNSNPTLHSFTKPIPTGASAAVALRERLQLSAKKNRASVSHFGSKPTTSATSALTPGFIARSEGVLERNVRLAVTAQARAVNELIAQGFLDEARSTLVVLLDDVPEAKDMADFWKCVIRLYRQSHAEISAVRLAFQSAIVACKRYDQERLALMDEFEQFLREECADGLKSLDQLLLTASGSATPMQSEVRAQPEQQQQQRAKASNVVRRVAFEDEEENELPNPQAMAPPPPPPSRVQQYELPKPVALGKPEESAPVEDASLPVKQEEAEQRQDDVDAADEELVFAMDRVELLQTEAEASYCEEEDDEDHVDVSSPLRLKSPARRVTTPKRMETRFSVGDGHRGDTPRPKLAAKSPSVGPAANTVVMGSYTGLAVVRGILAPRVATPVRRSSRTNKTENLTVSDALKRSNYAYAPNPALQPAAAEEEEEHKAATPRRRRASFREYQQG